jgi:hypothetical protein
VKIAAGQRLVGLREDQGIIGDAVRLGRQRRRGLPNEIEHGAHDLRLAAQAIGILHAIIVGEVRRADGAARHQRAQRRGDLDLTAMAAQRVNARVERCVGAFRRVRRERAGDERRPKYIHDREQARQRLRGRELGAVEEREPLLRTERGGRETSARQRSRRRHGLAAPLRVADAEHGRRQMCERREIAGCADRALAWDDWDHVACQHGFEQGDRCRTHAGRAAPEARELQRHHQPHAFGPRRLADAGGMGQHDVALKRGEVA